MLFCVEFYGFWDQHLMRLDLTAWLPRCHPKGFWYPEPETTENTMNLSYNMLAFAYNISALMATRKNKEIYALKQDNIEW